MVDKNALGAVLPVSDDEDSSPLVPVPFSFSKPSTGQGAPLTKLISDDRAISRLLEQMLFSAGLTPLDAAKRLGIAPSSMRQYLNGRRSNPGVKWFLRFADLCGAQIMVELRKK